MSNLESCIFDYACKIEINSFIISCFEEYKFIIECRDVNLSLSLSPINGWKEAWYFVLSEMQLRNKRVGNMQSTFSMDKASMNSYGEK